MNDDNLSERDLREIERLFVERGPAEAAELVAVQALHAIRANTFRDLCVKMLPEIEASLHPNFDLIREVRAALCLPNRPPRTSLPSRPEPIIRSRRNVPRGASPENCFEILDDGLWRALTLEEYRELEVQTAQRLQGLRSSVDYLRRR